MKQLRFNDKIITESEILNVLKAISDGVYTHSTFCDLFESKLSSFLNTKHCLAVNSGSSANLLAFATLMSPELKDRRIKRGDEVITVACGFPTTISPIFLLGAIPVFVDVTIPEYNIGVSKLKQALSSKTKAVFIAHTLGNPFDIDAVQKFCKDNNLWLIEDNCDALGSKWGDEYTGTFGDIATSSFYPAHHITTCEGGAVYTKSSELYKIALSLRDWGRDCVCRGGEDNTCNKRFSKQFGDLPIGYDHKYVYSHFGFNLKMTEFQGAFGVAQIDKLNDIVRLRKNNFKQIYIRLSDSNKIILPECLEKADPSWFGFPITIKEDGRLLNVVNKLEGYGIQTRRLFAGNITRHPCVKNLNADDYRIVGDLNNSDIVTNNTFWVGVNPTFTIDDIDYMCDKIKELI